MGNRLVDLTETLIRKVNTFFNKFNKSMLFVQLDTFIFQEADYITVSMKECEEIAQIFSAYEININKVEADYVPYKLRVSLGTT